MDDDLIGQLNELLKKVVVIGYVPGAPNAATAAFYDIVKDVPGDSPLWEQPVKGVFGELPLAVAAAAMSALPPQFTNYALKYHMEEEDIEGTVGMILIALNIVPDNFDLWNKPLFDDTPDFTYLDFYESRKQPG